MFRSEGALTTFSHFFYKVCVPTELVKLVKFRRNENFVELLKEWFLAPSERNILKVKNDNFILFFRN